MYNPKHFGKFKIKCEMCETSEKSLSLVINGKSAGNPELCAAIEHFRSIGHRLDVRVTWEAGDAVRFSADAADADYDVVVACGGDGTLNEVVEGIVSTPAESSIAVAVVPLGTANDFAVGCRIPVGDVKAALELAINGNPSPIDVGVANDRHFVNVATGGFGAEVTARTPPDMKNALGGAAYTLMGIVTAMSWNPRRCRLKFGDGTSLEGDLSLLAVGNGRQSGGGYELCPRAFLDDGLLDLMVVHGADLPSLGTVLHEMSHPEDESNRFASYRQVRSILVEADDVMQINLDGEPMREDVFQFGILPQRLRMMLPVDAPLSQVTP